MKRKQVLFVLVLLTISALVVSSTVIFAQPEAKQICYYNTISGSKEIPLKDMPTTEAKCTDDKELLELFNSAKVSVVSFRIWHGGKMGTFTDKNNKVHQIRISNTDGYIVDVTSNKTYYFDDQVKERRWYDLLNARFSDSGN